MGCDRAQTVMTVSSAAFIGKRERETLCAPSWKCVSMIVGLPPWLITARCDHYGLYTSFRLLLYAKRLKNTEWELWKWHKLLLSRRMWREYPGPICLSRLPSPYSWMLVIKRHSYYRRWRTNNRWRSVDAHFQDGVGSVSLSCFVIKAANTMFMAMCNLSPPWLPEIHDQQSLTLRWRSFSGYCRARVCVHFDHYGGQCIETKPWCTNVNMLRLSVAYLNAIINVKPETQIWGLELSGLAKPGKLCGLTGTGLGLASQVSAGRVAWRFLTWTGAFGSVPTRNRC